MPYATCPDCQVEMHYRGQPGLPLPAPCKAVRENVGGACIWPANAPGERLETVVANIHRDKELIEQARREGRYVYIGRPSGSHNQWGFGNPFSYKDDTKAMVITDNPITAIDPAGMATISIRLEEPLPCGILDGSGQCGRPAHAASIWPGPVPGQWAMLPVCREHVERMSALYKRDEETSTGER